MRGILISLALLSVASSASAGVYNTLEPHPDVPPEKVRSVVGQLRAVAVMPKGRLDPASLRAHYLRLAASLEREQDEGTLSTVDRVNLGASYIRLGRLRDAIRLLTKGDPRHFLIQANLASAYFLNGDLDLAVRHQQSALDQWPGVWATWKAGQGTWYRECDRVFLRLMMLRQADSRGGRNMGPKEIDPIFKGLRFIGPDKEYGAGQLRPREMFDVVPSNAYGIVLQLVLWYPQDSQLYWMLAEMLNASGHVGVAHEILNELVDTGLAGAFKDLNKHRQILRSGARLHEKLKPPSSQLQLIGWFAAIPKGSLSPIGIGAIADAVGAATPIAMTQLFERPPIAPMPGVGTDQPFVAPQPQLPFNWKHVTVGFTFGFLVAALIGFQWQEWRRRRAIHALDPADDLHEPSPGTTGSLEAETGIKSAEVSSVRPREG